MLPPQYIFYHSFFSYLEAILKCILEELISHAIFLILSTTIALHSCLFQSIPGKVLPTDYLMNSYFGISGRICSLKCKLKCQCESASYGLQICSLFSASLRGQENEDSFRTQKNIYLYVQSSKSLEDDNNRILLNDEGCGSKKMNLCAACSRWLNETILEISTNMFTWARNRTCK